MDSSNIRLFANCPLGSLRCCCSCSWVQQPLCPVVPQPLGDPVDPQASCDPELCTWDSNSSTRGPEEHKGTGTQAHCRLFSDSAAQPPVRDPRVFVNSEPLGDEAPSVACRQLRRQCHPSLVYVPSTTLPGSTGFWLFVQGASRSPTIGLALWPRPPQDWEGSVSGPEAASRP